MGPFDAYTQPEQPASSAVLRPRALFAPGSLVLGLRASSVSFDGMTRTLSVWLYGDPPTVLVDPTLWSLQGGSPAEIATAPTVVPAATDPDGNPVPAHLDMIVTTPSGALPSRAPYRLGIDPAAFAALGLSVDPRRAFLPVRLRPECGEAPDCVQVLAPQEPLTPPDYDTLARDFVGLRAMLLDRLRALDPGADESPADVMVTTIELMAHLGDLLSYRLDRVATESWLPTARRRAAVTRHARLVDFAVPPAVSASTVVQVVVPRPGSTTADAAFAVMTGDTATDAAGDPNADPHAANFTLEIDGPLTVRASQAEIALYDWIDRG